MVDFRKETRGDNAMKGVNVVIRTFSNSMKVKDGASVGQYLDVQLDARDPRAFSKRVNPETGRERKTADNPDLHFVSRRSESNGSPRIDNGQYYHASQVDSLIEQAKADGNYHERTLDGRTDKEGNPVVESVFGVKADAMIVKAASSNAKAVMLDTKTITKSDYAVGPEAIKYQIEGMKAASKNLKAEKAAKEAAKEADAPQAEAPAAEVPQAEAAEKPAPKKRAPRKAAAKITPKDSAPTAEAAQPEVEGEEFSA